MRTQRRLVECLQRSVVDSSVFEVFTAREALLVGPSVHVQATQTHITSKLQGQRCFSQVATTASSSDTAARSRQCVSCSARSSFAQHARLAERQRRAFATPSDAKSTADSVSNLLESYIKLRASGRPVTPEQENMVMEQLAKHADTLHAHYGALGLLDQPAQIEHTRPHERTARSERRRTPSCTGRPQVPVSNAPNFQIWEAGLVGMQGKSSRAAVTMTTLSRKILMQREQKRSLSESWSTSLQLHNTRQCQNTLPHHCPYSKTGSWRHRPPPWRP